MLKFLLKEERNAGIGSSNINPGNSLARYRLGVIDLGVINMCRAKYQEAFQIFNRTPFDNNPNLDVSYIERSSTAGNGNGTSG